MSVASVDPWPLLSCTFSCTQQAYSAEETSFRGDVGFLPAGPDPLLGLLESLLQRPPAPGRAGLRGVQAARRAGSEPVQRPGVGREGIHSSHPVLLHLLAAAGRRGWETEAQSLFRLSAGQLCEGTTAPEKSESDWRQGLQEKKQVTNSHALFMTQYLIQCVKLCILQAIESPDIWDQLLLCHSPSPSLRYSTEADI